MMNIQSFREVHALSSGTPVMSHVPTRIVRRNKGSAFMLTRFVISNAGTEGGTRDWIINDIEVDGISQLAVKDLPGALFSSRGIVASGKRASSVLYFSGLAVIERESEVVLTVTYIGSNSLGCPLFSSIIGGSPPQRPTVLPITTKHKLLPTVATTITAALNRPLAIDRLEIEDMGTDGGAADWIVNDIRIDGTSQFVQSGDVPGDMFSTNSIDNFVKMRPGAQIELTVTYIGLNKIGCCFSAHLLGTVVRDDLQQPPPDVQAFIRTFGTLDEEVIGRCEWRPPSSSQEPECP